MSRTPLTLPADHPALPGHFPGRPLVPGVVILDLVIAAAGRAGYAVTAVTTAKFSAPLYPEMVCELALQAGPGGPRFTLCHADVTLASGTLRAEGG